MKIRIELSVSTDHFFELKRSPLELLLTVDAKFVLAGLAPNREVEVVVAVDVAGAVLVRFPNKEPPEKAGFVEVVDPNNDDPPESVTKFRTLFRLTGVRSKQRGTSGQSQSTDCRSSCWCSQRAANDCEAGLRREELGSFVHRRSVCI